MVRETEKANQFSQGAPRPTFTGQTVFIWGMPAAALQADSQSREDLLGQEAA